MQCSVLVNDTDRKWLTQKLWSHTCACRRGEKNPFFKKRLDIQRAQQTVQGHHTERKENTGAKDFLERAWMQTQVSSCCLPAFCCVQKNKNFLSTGIVHLSLLHYTQHHDSRWLLGTAKRRAGIREDRVYKVSGFKDVSQKKNSSYFHVFK